MTGQASARLCLYTRAWRSAGAGLFAQELAQGLVDAGARLTFIAPRAPEGRFEQPRAGLARRRPPHERPGATRLRNMALSLSRIVCGALFLLRARFSHRVFVISIPDPLPLFLPVLLLLTLSGARIIFVAHDPLPHAWRLPRPLRGLERAAHMACYRLAARVVVLSEPTAVRMRTLFPFVTRRLRVIEHGVFPVPGVPPLPGNRTLLIFGALRRNKGIVAGMEGVIAAHRGGVPVKLIVAGAPTRDEADHADEIREIAAQARDVIDLRLGYVEDGVLARLLAQSDALLLPYIDFDSQSGVALLAASNGRPIIAARAGGIGALMDEGMPATVIPVPVDATGVRAAVDLFLAESAEHWRGQAAAYRERTLELRSWHRIGAHYLALSGELERNR